MRSKLDSVLTVSLVVCAVVTTSVVLYRAILAPSASSARLPERAPVFIPTWRSQASNGILLGPRSAPVQLIEFSDFECPFCASLHNTLKLLRERYPLQVSITYVHFPLRMHRFAVPAARVAECADDQGRFEAMYDRLFDEQEAFGLKSWSDYAVEAGVPALATFDSCVRRTDSVPRIEAGKRWGVSLDVRETPTVIINGWMLGRPPTIEELTSMVEAILAGKSPVPDRKQS
jgi:protein-disulfide isomerase